MKWLVFVLLLSGCATPGNPYEVNYGLIRYKHVYGSRPDVDLELPSGVKIRAIRDGWDIEGIKFKWEKELD